MYTFVLLQEGPNNDRGVVHRAFQELFELSNNDTTSTSKFSFSISMFELTSEVSNLFCNGIWVHVERFV